MLSEPELVITESKLVKRLHLRDFEKISPDLIPIIQKSSARPPLQRQQGQTTFLDLKMRSAPRSCWTWEEETILAVSQEDINFAAAACRGLHYDGDHLLHDDSHPQMPRAKTPQRSQSPLKKQRPTSAMKSSLPATNTTWKLMSTLINLLTVHFYIFKRDCPFIFLLINLANWVVYYNDKKEIC